MNFEPSFVNRNNYQHLTRDAGYWSLDAGRSEAEFQSWVELPNREAVTITKEFILCSMRIGEEIDPSIKNRSIS